MRGKAKMHWAVEGKGVRLCSRAPRFGVSSGLSGRTRFVLGRWVAAIRTQQR